MIILRSYICQFFIYFWSHFHPSWIFDTGKGTRLGQLWKLVSTLRVDITRWYLLQWNIRVGMGSVSKILHKIRSSSGGLWTCLVCCALTFSSFSCRSRSTQIVVVFMAFVIFTLRGALNEAENTGEMENEGVEKVHREPTWADNESLSRSTRVQRRRYDRYSRKWNDFIPSFGWGLSRISITHEPAYK